MRSLIAVIAYFLAQYRSFWRVRFFWKRAEFYFRRFLYQINRKAIFYKRQIINLAKIARLGLKDVFLILLIFVLIYWIPYYFFGIDFKDDRNIESAYVEILSVVAAVCGVIIGLYYAALVSLGSDTYSKMPIEAKELLRKEPIGNAFVWFLSSLTFSSITLLALYYFNFEDTFLGIQLILVGSGLAIFGFIKLGYNLFYFTDPTILAGSALDLLSESFKLSKASSFNSGKPEFQQHYNKQANLGLQSYELLAKIVKDEGHQHLQTESYLGLCQKGMSVLSEYLKLKDSIPYDSKFFQLKIKHKKWYESSDTDVELHERIGHLPYEEIRDRDFVENRILEIALDCIQLNLKQKNYDVAYRALSMLTGPGKELVKRHNSKILVNFYKKIEKLILESAPSITEIESTGAQDYYLQLIDCIGLLKSELLIAFLQRLEDISDEKVKMVINSIPWGSEIKIFKVGLPSFTHELLIHLNKTIAYEISIHGKRISPDWYLYNVLFLKYAEQIHLENNEIRDFIFSQVNSLQESVLYKSSEKDKWANLFVCCYLDRMLEHYAKLEIVIQRFGKLHDVLHSYSKMPGLKWPEYDLQAASKGLKDFRISLTELLSKAGTFFNLYKFTTEYPDYGGKFLHFSGNDILDQLINKQALDENTFKHFFVGSLVMFDKLKDDLKQFDNLPVENQLHFMIAPMIDLVTLSGLVFLVAKFSGKNELEDIVKKYWDNYLNEDSESRLKKIAIILTYPEGNTLMGLPHRYSQRFNWERDLYDYFINNVESKKEWSRSRGFVGHEYYVVTHDSALISYLVAKKLEYMHSENDGLHVFVDFYLVSKATSLGIENLKFCRDQGDLLERVERQGSEDEE